jgi:hypothetical protein
MLHIESVKHRADGVFVTTVLDPACINPNNKITFNNVNELFFESIEQANEYVEYFNKFFSKK